MFNMMKRVRLPLDPPLKRPHDRVSRQSCMESVRFLYGEFRDYHRGLGGVADDVVVRMCIADYPVIKYANPERGEDAQDFLHWFPYFFGTPPR